MRYLAVFALSAAQAAAPADSYAAGAGPLEQLQLPMEAAECALVARGLLWQCFLLLDAM